MSWKAWHEKHSDLPPIILIRGVKLRWVRHIPGTFGFHILLNGWHLIPKSTQVANARANKNTIITHKTTLILRWVPRMIRRISRQIETLMQRVVNTLNNSTNTSYINAFVNIGWIYSTCRPNPYLTLWVSKIEQHKLIGYYQFNDNSSSIVIADCV